MDLRKGSNVGSPQSRSEGRSTPCCWYRPFGLQLWAEAVLPCNTGRRFRGSAPRAFRSGWSIAELLGVIKQRVDQLRAAS
jgi:hypothetical protein